MSVVYLLSDPHFGHTSMAQKRGFNSVEEHDNYIIDNWNSVVTKRDKVYLLGDITMEKSNYEILRRLRGDITVVLGNHDKPNHVRQLLLYVSHVAGAIKYKDTILTHIPIHPIEIDRFRLNIHGHTHEKNVDHPKYVNVSCEVLDYTPIKFTDIIKSHNEQNL